LIAEKQTFLPLSLKTYFISFLLYHAANSTSSSSSSRAALRRVSHNKTPKTKHASQTHVTRPGSITGQKVVDCNFPLSRSLGDNIYNLIQTGNTSSLVSSASGPAYASLYLTLSQLDQYTSLVAVFDQYRIKAVEISFRPRISQESAASANTGLFCTVIDVDDAASLTSFAQAEDYQTALVGRGFECQTRTFKPHAAMALYSGSFSGYGNTESPWIDSSSSTVQHYGVKTAWTITDSAYTIDYTCRYWLQFKNVR
jgi:hypothetical protein